MTTVVDRPVPEITPRMRPFWAAASEGRLLVQRCGHCGKKHFPAIEICNGCLRDELSWIDVSGRGSVFSFIVMHQVYHPAFAERVPYVVAEVKLDEGPRIISNVIGCEPAQVTIDMPVVVDFERLDSTIGSPTLPMFRPAP